MRRCLRLAAHPGAQPCCRPRPSPPRSRRRPSRRRTGSHAILRAARLDALIVLGDDQRELFQDACRPAIGIYYGDTIRNAAAPEPPPEDWFRRAQQRGWRRGATRTTPATRRSGWRSIEGLSARGFDITAIKALVGEQAEGHAFSFLHRRYLQGSPARMVPIFLNTDYPPNQPTPERCFALGLAIGELVAEFPGDIRVGVFASGGLSHYLVDEELDRAVIEALHRKDYVALAALSPQRLQSGTSEIRNWICVAAAARDLDLDWITYVPAYRSSALTGVGLCFARWS